MVEWSVVPSFFSLFASILKNNFCDYLEAHICCASLYTSALFSLCTDSICNKSA